MLFSQPFKVRVPLSNVKKFRGLPHYVVVLLVTHN